MTQFFFFFLSLFISIAITFPKLNQEDIGLMGGDHNWKNEQSWTMYSFLLLLSAGSISLLKSILSQYKKKDSFTKINKANLYQCDKDCHQDNLSFACLQFYKCNFCLNILVSIISFHKKWRFNRNDCNDIQHQPSNLSQCSIKYSALFFVPINFEMTILSTLTSQIFVFVL